MNDALSLNSILSKECLAVLMDLDPTEKPALQAGAKGGGTKLTRIYV